MSVLRSLPVAALGLLALACRTAADIEPPEPLPEIAVPAAWSAAPSGEVREATPSEWWRALGDPVLDELVAEALERSWSLAAAVARLDAALARARIAGGELEPQVGIGLDGSRAKRNFIGFPIPGRENEVLAVTSTTLSLGLDVSWEADLWGRLRSAAAAASLDAAASREELEAARLSLAGQVVKGYLGLLEARQQVALAERTADSRRRTEAQVRARYERGLVAPFDLRLAMTQVANVEATLRARQQTLDAIARQLEVLLGRYPAARVGGARELPVAPAPVPAGLPAELLLRRPDLRVAHRRALAASARVQSARAALYPRLSLTGSTGTASNELEDLLDGDFSIWSLAARLLQPLFQGGRLRAGVRLASAGEDEAVSSFVQATLLAFAEVETALATQVRLGQQVGALEQATEQSRAAARLALARYSAGLGEYLSVLEGDRQAFAAESSLLEARRLRLSAWVDLVLALGGGVQSGAADSDTQPPAENGSVSPAS